MGAFGRNSAHARTGWGGYFWGSSGQRMKVDAFVCTYFGGAAQRWQRLSGNGGGFIVDTAAAWHGGRMHGRSHAFQAWCRPRIASTVSEVELPG